MRKQPFKVLLADLALAFSATVTSNSINFFTGIYDHLADGVGFDPGTSTALGPECEEIYPITA